MAEEPLTSVIIPMFNASAFIGEAIESVRAQTYKNWEMLVVDNCSTDNSREIAGRFVSCDSRIRLISCEHNSGSPSRPRNIGIKNAGGKYLCFLDADDLWLQDKLQKQITYLERHEDVFLLYGRYQILKNGSLMKGRVEPALRKM